MCSLASHLATCNSTGIIIKLIHALYLPQCESGAHTAYSQNSIFHTVHIHNSIHHSELSIFYNVVSIQCRCIDEFCYTNFILYLRGSPSNWYLPS